MVVCWILVTLLSIPLFFLDYNEIDDIYYKYVILVLDGLILITILFTYVILELLFKIHCKEKSLAESGKTPVCYQKNSNRNCKFVRIFLLILTTFLIFVVIPDIYFVYRGVIFDDMSMA